MDWLALHFPDLGLELFQGTQTQQPTVLVEDNRVLLCNGAADQAGIRPGATLATARSIDSRLQHQQRQPTLEAQRLCALADALYQLTPDVAIAEPAALLLHSKGSRRLFHRPEQLARAAAAEAKAMGHRVIARAASTPAAALALAVSGCRTLAQVPLGVLPQLNPEIRPAQIERFANMGLRTLGDVLALPAGSLAQRFGKDIAALLDQLAGRRGDPRTFIIPKASFEQTLHLLDPIRSKQGLAGPMLRLATLLERWLTGRQLAAGELHWTFESATTQLGESARREVNGNPSDRDPGRESMTIGFARPLTGARRFLRLSQTRLEQQALPGEVISVRLCASTLEPLSAREATLFPEPGLPEGLAADARTPDDLLDQLQARLGAAACRKLQTRAQHHPEWMIRQPRQQHFPTRTAPARRAAGHAKALPDLQRPLWLRPQPQPVARDELDLLHGPERIQTGWWHQGTLRDYYIASRQTRTGDSYCWVYQDQHDRWYLHGYFA